MSRWQYPLMNYLTSIKKTFDEPYFELFLWSVFTKRVSLIEFFWHKLQEPLLGAILAASIYSKLAVYYKNLTTYSNKFEVLHTSKKQFVEKINQVRNKNYLPSIWLLTETFKESLDAIFIFKQIGSYFFIDWFLSCFHIKS